LYDPTDDGNTDHWNSTNNNCVLENSDTGFCSYPEAHFDVDDDWMFDVNAEEFFDQDGDNAFDTAPGVYQGVRCTEAAKSAGHCASMMEVREQVSLIMSSGTFTLDSSGVPTNMALGSNTTVNFSIADSNDNIPPSGTELSFSCSGGSVAVDYDGVTGAIPNQFRAFPYGKNDRTADGGTFTGELAVTLSVAADADPGVSICSFKAGTASLVYTISTP
jgi:hypothetical protein